MKARFSCTVVAFLLAAGLWAAIPAAAGDDTEKFEGTQKEDLAKLKLPQPSTVKVAVLPFWDYKSSQRHIDDAAESCRDLLDRHGFMLIPQEAITKAVKEDKEIEPGQPFRRADAARLGQVVGADWVVYGEIYELDTYRKTTFWSATKKGRVSLKVSVLNVPSGELLYWQKRSHRASGSIWYYRRATSQERKALDEGMDHAFEMFFAALPEHKVKPVEKAPAEEDGKSGSSESKESK